MVAQDREGGDEKPAGMGFLFWVMKIFCDDDCITM